MTYNIINGDAMRDAFNNTGISGEVIVFREALIEGDVSGKTLDSFWSRRAAYMEIQRSDYDQAVVSEMQKLFDADDFSEFNLWFEYDLFCQVNFWFLLSIINGLHISKKVFAVFTTHLPDNSPKFWNGFGNASSDDLKTCFKRRLGLNDQDLRFGTDLWSAFKQDDIETLEKMSVHPTPAFPNLKEIVAAHADRFPNKGEPSRVEKVIERIIKDNSSRFEDVFKEFWKTESIYGFGDVQVKHLYDKVIKNNLK